MVSVARVICRGVVAAVLGAAGLLRGMDVPDAKGTSGLWYRYPLPGAEVKSLVADPSTPGGFYLGTAQGGVYRSTDAGRSWVAPPRGLPFPGYAVTALAVDPLNHAILWAGLTGVVRGGLLARSDDRGRSFEEVRRWDDRAGSRVVAVSAQSGRRVLAVGGDYGIEISEDDGGTWRVSTPPLDSGAGISSLAFHPFRPDVLFCGSFRHPFLSTDLGKSWRRIANGMVEDTEVFALDFSPKNADDIWAATCGWVYRSRDGGASWTRYREGLTDRRTHVVKLDPADGKRLLAGTTGGLFESRDEGKTFRRLGPEVVINALAFDPRRPQRLLIGTESDGVLVSDDGGVSVAESNRGLAEARVSSVAVTASARVVIARAADGPAGGLWTVDAKTGEVRRLASSPSATVLALAAMGDALFAATPDGIFRAERPEAPFMKVLSYPTRGFATDGTDRLLAATGAGVYEARGGGRSWARLGSLVSSVVTVRRARFASRGLKTFAAESGGATLWWDGKDWAKRDAGQYLSGGFGRPRSVPRIVPEPIGLDVDLARSVLLFRPEDDAGGFALALPESGLAVAGWAGDPREPAGLYVATVGRGLFRFVPNGL